MARRLVECVPNYSEGRRPEIIEALVALFKKTKGVYLFDYRADEDHNRLVVSLVGEPEPMEDALLEAARVAMENIGHGASPRRPSPYRRSGCHSLHTSEEREHGRMRAPCACLRGALLAGDGHSRVFLRRSGPAPGEKAPRSHQKGTVRNTQAGSPLESRTASGQGKCGTPSHCRSHRDRSTQLSRRVQRQPWNNGCLHRERNCQSRSCFQRRFLSCERHRTRP